jgi:hypothetical protein
MPRDAGTPLILPAPPLERSSDGWAGSACGCGPHNGRPMAALLVVIGDLTSFLLAHCPRPAATALHSAHPSEERSSRPRCSIGVLSLSDIRPLRMRVTSGGLSDGEVPVGMRADGRYCFATVRERSMSCVCRRRLSPPSCFHRKQPTCRAVAAHRETPLEVCMSSGIAQQVGYCLSSGVGAFFRLARARGRSSSCRWRLMKMEICL